jgi:hypothetical protein
MSITDPKPKGGFWPEVVFRPPLVEGSSRLTAPVLFRPEGPTWLFSQFAGARLNPGIVHQPMGEWEQARTAFQRCLEIDPRNAEARQRLETLRSQ